MSDRTGVRGALRLEPGPGNTRNSEGAFVELRDGRIMLIYSRFLSGRGGDHDPAELAARFSADGGLTWSKRDDIVLGNEAGLNVMSVSLLRLDDGDLLLFYLLKNALSDCKPVVRRSSDDGTTWGDPVDMITDNDGYLILIADRVVVSASGRLIAPIADHGPAWTNDPVATGEAVCYLSDDQGRSWRRGRGIAAVADDPTGTGLQEPGIVQLRDRRLLMFSRTVLGSQYLCHSDDDGETWTQPVPSDIRSPRSPASIKRIPSTGDLLLVWNDSYDPGHSRHGARTPLTAAISADDGRTWRRRQVLEDDPNGHYCYTAMHFVAGDPERVLLAYCAGDSRRNGLATLQVTSVDVPWLYATGGTR